jgi:2-(1,2-epoxy-1,2-dihydrophenyl)acetyl-CoA isomerase
MSANAHKPAVSMTHQGAVAVLRLDRPERLNTIDDELGADLLACLRRAAADAATRAVLLTGAGRSFMAGADLTLFKDDMDAAPQTAGRLIDSLHESLRLMRGMPKPVVAAVQGPVAGGGLGLALACDLVVAADDTVFVSAYTRIGTSPDAGTTWSLTHLLGARRALQMILLNDPVDAATALSWGLVNTVVPRTELDASALALAMRLAAGASGAMAAVKRLVGEAVDTPFVAQLDREKASFMTEAAKPDFREGVMAFLERRKAAFR